jgi:hypothetical protein
MARTEHRKRRAISVRGARLLPLVGFRYSTSRDAYVVRVVGNHVGPVFQLQAAHRPQVVTPVGEESSRPPGTVDGQLAVLSGQESSESPIMGDQEPVATPSGEEPSESRVTADQQS